MYARQSFEQELSEASAHNTGFISHVVSVNQTWMYPQFPLIQQIYNLELSAS